jgi:hypothetical protein
MRAETRIAVHTDRTIVAHVRVRPGDRAVEHIAHEIEHVIERIEGVNLLMESTRGGSGVSMGAGAFETRRAVEAGRRVASEAPQATRRQAR